MAELPTEIVFMNYLQLGEKQKRCRDVVIDRDSSNAIGSVFTKQWPEIKHVFHSTLLGHYTNEKTVGLVAEKLDGSNVAVTSRKVIASRRNVLLSNPSAEELQKFKFSGVKLHAVANLFERLGQLEQSLQKYFPFLGIEVILYGELIQKGTATSTEDKFNYRSRGYQVGEYWIFGAGIAFDQHLTETLIEKCIKHLESHSFVVVRSFNELIERSHLIILMNEKLRETLETHQITTVVAQEKKTLTQALSFYQQKLVSNEIEGIVLSFGGEILKWKGLDESYPDAFLNDIALIKSKVKKEVFDPIVSVALEAQKNRSRMKKEKQTLFLLEKAYKSALTKLGNLEDRKKKGNVSEEEKLKYLEALEQEMVADSHCDHDYQVQLSAFISSKLK